MRVSEQEIYGLLVGNLQRLREGMLKAQNQVSTGKRVTAPSDDPVSFARIVSDKATLAATDQRLRNIQFGTTRLNEFDSRLRSVQMTLGRVKELAVQFGSDISGAQPRAIGALEVRQLFQQLLQDANSRLDGQALFGGTSQRGRATGVAVGAPVTLSDGVNDTLAVTVDGVASGTIDLTALANESLSGPALAARVQTQINADAALTAAGKSVTVSFDTDHLVIVSDSHGPASTVQVTGGTAYAAVGFNGGSTTSGADAFAYQALTGARAGNTGGGLIGQGKVVDPNAVTLDDYLIRFTSPTTYDVLDVSQPVTVATNPANRGGAARADSGVIDPSQLTLHGYAINFTSDTQYDIVDTTTATTVSSGNTYVSGGSIDFHGLRVVLAGGSSGGPKAGDSFAVSLNPKTVQAGQTYTSAGTIAFHGVQLAIRDGASAPAGGDLFVVRTGMQYQGDAGIQAIEIGDNQTVKTNVSGDQAFAGPTVDLFASIKRLVASLNGNFAGGIQQGVADSDRLGEQMSAAQGEVGALTNRLDAAKSTLEDFKGFVESSLSNEEDIDIAKAISDLTLQDYALQATAQAASRIFDSSLLRFLR